MTRMTTEEKVEQVTEVLEFLVAKVDEAHKKGAEQVHNVLMSVAFSIGNLTATSVTSEGLGPISGHIINALISGIEAGVQQSDLPGMFTVVRKTL